MGKNRNTILYIDDEYINLELFRANFKDEYKVFTAESAKEGLEILEKKDIDVIISDLRMPEMNGIELIEIIKKNNPEKVCILLTAYIESEVMLRAINKELVFRYVLKPWKHNELKEIIEEAFKK